MADGRGTPLALYTPLSWSVRVCVAARETHGRVCPLCYLLPVVTLIIASRIARSGECRAGATQKLASHF